MKQAGQLAAALALATWTMLGAAYAQDIAAPSDAELQQYATAIMAVQEVVDEYRAEAANIESEDAMQRLQQEYQQELIDTVQSEGITVERYNEIFEASQTNPQLADRIDNALNALE